MTKLRFYECNDTGVCCEDADTGIQLHLNQDRLFQNRNYIFSNQDFLFDGYSIWFESDETFFQPKETMSVSLCVIPLGVSSGGDGLFSCYDQREKRGLLIALGRDKTVRITLGDGKRSLTFSSINVHLSLNVRNLITVVYRGDAGWCDLYINGVLSNRRQFRRHTEMAWPRGKAYLGKLVDHETWEENTGTGCFYGFMQWFMIENRAFRDAEVKALHGEYYTGTLEDEAAFLGALDRKAYVQDRQRPRYHLIAPGKWMNEPHGPLFFKGWYHIFYQANPHAPLWDAIQWGHMMSRDMVHWKDCPPALCPEEGIDPEGCWSGSGLIDKSGIPRIYYTAGNNGRFPNQGVAMAVPMWEQSPGLEQWEKYSSLVQEQDIGWLGEFRDPFVWLQEDVYFMLVGTGDANNGGGNAALYSSLDGIRWESHGLLLDYDYDSNQEVGHVWELPTLLPLRDEKGKVACHILAFCACQIEKSLVETYYFLGKWDCKEKTFTKYHEKARLFDLGHGIFTGSSGFVTPDGRSVLFTIAQGKRDPVHEFHSGWAHNGGLPLELSVRDGVCRYQPIRELLKLRGKKLLELADVTPVEANERLASFSGDYFCMEYVVEDACGTVRVCYGNGAREVYYHRLTRRLGARDENGNEIGLWRGPEDDVDIGDEKICFTCYLDGSMLEVYVNGVKSVSLRGYAEGNRRFQVAERTGKIKKLVLWEMGSAY